MNCISIYRAVTFANVAPGALYLRRGGDNADLCLKAKPEPIAGSAEFFVLVASLIGKQAPPQLHLATGYEKHVVAELPAAAIRIDAEPPDTSFLHNDPTPGQLVLMPEGTYLAVLPRSTNEGEKLVRISDGEIRGFPESEHRITISRWSIVVPQEKERLVLATFPAPAGKP
jgi:hypothetical protein